MGRTEIQDPLALKGLPVRTATTAQPGPQGQSVCQAWRVEMESTAKTVFPDRRVPLEQPVQQARPDLRATVCLAWTVLMVRLVIPAHLVPLALRVFKVSPATTEPQGMMARPELPDQPVPTGFRARLAKTGTTLLRHTWCFSRLLPGDLRRARPALLKH